MAWVLAWRCKLQKGCTRLATTSDKVYQLLAHGQWFSPDTLASSTTKTGRHDIAEILLKVTLNTINQIKSNQIVYMPIAVGENSMALMQQPITNSLENIYSLTFF